MPRLYTASIPDSQCIGDSLDTINNNYSNLDTAVQDLSSQTISITDTSTIDLTYDAGSRNLTASVKLSSITPAFLSPTFTLSASQISNRPQAFKKFRESKGDDCKSSYFRANFYISQDNSLYAAGVGGTYNQFVPEQFSGAFGQGGYHFDAIVGGYRKLMIPLLQGEYVEKLYTAGTGDSSGYWFSTIYVLTNFKNLYGTGYNGYGQLGIANGDVTSRSTWVKVAINNVEDFSVVSGMTYAHHCLAVNTAGELYAWGYGGQGNLGLGVGVTGAQVPTRVNTGAIAGKKIKRCFAFGTDITTPLHYSFVIDENGDVYSTGNNNKGQLGQNNNTLQTTFQSIHVPAGQTIKGDYVLSSQSADTSNGPTTYLVYEKELWTCGYNGYGNLGRGNTGTDSTRLEKVANLSVDQITVSRNSASTILVKQRDGSLRVWGYNDVGNLGLPATTTAYNTPSIPTNNPQNIVKIKSGDHQYPMSAFLNTNGEIWTCGYNYYGQLGIGSATNSSVFTKVIANANIKFVDFDIVGMNSGTALIAVDQNGDLWSCGYSGNHTLAAPYRDGASGIPAPVTIASGNYAGSSRILQKTVVLN